MEQQEQALQKQTAQKETSHNQPQQQERRSFTGVALQALRDGGAVWELPRQSLEELAATVGNSNMLALTAMRTPEAELHQTQLLGAQPQTAVTEVPDTACPLMQASDLTAGTWPASAFDPAGLA